MALEMENMMMNHGIFCFPYFQPCPWGYQPIFQPGICTAQDMKFTDMTICAEDEQSFLVSSICVFYLSESGEFHGIAASCGHFSCGM